MGFTPNAGIVMGSRCGDIDYSIIPYIMKESGMSLEEVDKIANVKRSPWNDMPNEPQVIKTMKLL